MHLMLNEFVDASKEINVSAKEQLGALRLTFAQNCCW
jgi:hypothetical protein